MAPDEGVEPPLTVLETAVIPLYQSGNMATRMGLEPMTTHVTGEYSNQLNYRAKMVDRVGFEPTTC